MNARANLIRRRKAARKMDAFRQARAPQPVRLRHVMVDVAYCPDTSDTWADFILSCFDNAATITPMK